MKSAIFVRATGHADVARRDRVAAGAVDPVAEARLGEQPGADEREPDPPEHLHLEGVLGEVRREEAARRRRSRSPCRCPGSRSCPVSFSVPRRVDALEDEEGRERDDEARQLRLHHRDAVDEADREAERGARSPSPARCSCPRASRGSRAAGPSCRSSRRPRGRTRRRSSAARPARRRSRTAPPGRSSRPRSPGSPSQLTAAREVAEGEEDGDRAEERADVRPGEEPRRANPTADEALVGPALAELRSGPWRVSVPAGWATATAAHPLARS